MLYNRWGDRLEILGNAGPHEIKFGRNREKISLTLLKVKILFDNGAQERFYFMESLKADGAWPELESALNAAPTLTLSRAALRAALKQAR